MRAYALIIKIHCINDMFGSFVNFIVSPVSSLIANANKTLKNNTRANCSLVPRLLRMRTIFLRALAYFKLISRRLQ